MQTALALFAIAGLMLVAAGCCPADGSKKKNNYNSGAGQEMLVVAPLTWKDPAGESLSVSPFAIRRKIHENPNLDLRPLWQQLNISAEMQTIWTRLRGGQPLSAPVVFDKCNGCKADLLRIDLDGRRGKEVLLNIYEPWGYSRYLVFKPVKEMKASLVHWALLGQADHDFARYVMPSHKVVYGRNKQWLVIRVQYGSGTGFAAYYDRWYEVGNDGVREVLTTPADGHDHMDCAELQRDAHTQFLKHRNEKGTDILEFLISVTWFDSCFDEWGEDRPILRKKRRAVYVRKPGAAEFVLDLSRSEILEKEINGSFSVDSYSKEDFLRDNLKWLSAVARGRDTRLAKWLPHFLDRVENTPERSELIRLLK